MENLLKNFEKYISFILMIIVMLFVCYQVLDLAVHFTLKMMHNIETRSFAPQENARPVAGVFFSILLTLEILQTIRIYAHDHTVKLKVILIVGIIAVTRKILMYEIEEPEPLVEFSIAALIISLCTGYYLVSRSERGTKQDAQKTEFN